MPYSEVKGSPIGWANFTGYSSREALVGLEEAEWSVFYHDVMKELKFVAYSDTLSRMLLLPLALQVRTI